MKHLKRYQAAICLLVLSLSLTGNALAQPGKQILIHPVILVHGLFGVDDDLDSSQLYNTLIKAGGYDELYVTTFAYVTNQRSSESGTGDDEAEDKITDSFQDISKVAEYLKAEVDYLYKMSGNTKVDIVSHSLGGLVTREYLRQNPSDHRICRFIDVGTPHSGSSLEDDLLDLAIPTNMKPSTINAMLGIVEEFGFKMPDKEHPAARQLLPGSPFLQKLNSNASDGTILYYMLYGDIQFQYLAQLFWFSMTSKTLPAGDLIVSSKNAATIPNLGQLEGSNPPNYKTVPYTSSNQLILLATILRDNKDWDVRTPLQAGEKLMDKLSEIQPNWHGGLLGNPKVVNKILSILDSEYVPRCRPNPPPTITLTPTATLTATLTSTPTNTPTMTATMTPEPASSLRGTVLQRSQCRYGPSQYHLFKTGFRPDAPVEVIGRDADGDWLQIQLQGSDEPCWINASLVQVEGDVMALPDTYPTDRRLPISDAFPQIALISASPGANGITASWVHFEIREDLKQTDTVEYVIEVWTCVDGKPAFYAVGTNDTVVSFQIDNSCGIASYAHLIGQDEHGFSFPTTIPLP